jgi:hypothetical protein
MVWHFGNAGGDRPLVGEAMDIDEKDVDKKDIDKNDIHNTMDVDDKPILEREWDLMDVDLLPLLFVTDPPMQPTGEPIDVDWDPIEVDWGLHEPSTTYALYEGQILGCRYRIGRIRRLGRGETPTGHHRGVYITGSVFLFFDGPSGHRREAFYTASLFTYHFVYFV